MDFIHNELIDRFLGYNVFLSALILISLGPIGVAFFYVMPVAVAVILYTKKRKLIWLSSLPQISIAIGFFVRQFFYLRSTEFPLMIKIIDAAVIFVTIVFQFMMLTFLTTQFLRRILK